VFLLFNLAQQIINQTLSYGQAKPTSLKKTWQVIPLF